jgi:hypothetical protein
MPLGAYAPNQKRFPAAQIVYTIDYDSDGADNGARDNSPIIFAGAIAPPLVLAIANQEYSFVVSKAKRIEFFCRTDDEVRYAYQEGGTFLPSIGYRTLRPGSEKDLNFGDGYFDGTVYFASSTAGAVVEIEVWIADAIDLQADGGSAEFDS